MSTEQSKPLSKEEKLKERKYMGSILTALGLIVGYVLVYFIGRVICLGWPWEAYSWRWWLNHSSPTSFSYIYGWLIHNNVFWAVMIVTVIVAILGKYRFSLSCSAGFLVGMVVGELFGKNPAGAERGLTHYGWEIWLLILLFSAFMGIIMEKLFKKESFSWRSKRFWIWCAVFVFGIVTIVLLVRANMWHP